MRTHESVRRDKLIHWKYCTCVHQERPEPLAGLGNESMRFPRSVIAETFLRQGLGVRGVVSNAAQKCSVYLQNRGSQVPRHWPTIPRLLLQRPRAIDKRSQTFD